MRHENLVNVLDMVIKDTDLWIFMEYCSGGNLQKYLQENNTLSVNEKIDIFLQILEGMVHLHENNIIHRDIKPTNIVVYKQAPGSAWMKLTNFDVSKFI